MQEFKSLVLMRIDKLLQGELEVDPIKVFIKQEPHKVKKLREHRERLILAISMIDTMIDRILFGWFQHGLVRNHMKTPIAVGWTPMKGGYRAIKRGPKLMADKSMWDWTVTWQARDMIEVIKRLHEPDPDWERLVDMRYDLLFKHSVYQFPTGLMVRQTTEGVMKSGCLLTIAGNSVMQLLMHLIAIGRTGDADGWFYAGGDDTIQDVPREPERYLAELDNMGAIVKEHLISDDGEFMGFGYNKTLPVPLYEKKHEFLLLHMPQAHQEDFLQSYMLMYANHPVMYGKLVVLARAMGMGELDRPYTYKQVWLG